MLSSAIPSGTHLFAELRRDPVLDVVSSVEEGGAAAEQSVEEHQAGVAKLDLRWVEAGRSGGEIQPCKKAWKNTEMESGHVFSEPLPSEGRCYYILESSNTHCCNSSGVVPADTSSLPNHCASNSDPRFQSMVACMALREAAVTSTVPDRTIGHTGGSRPPHNKPFEMGCLIDMDNRLVAFGEHRVVTTVESGTEDRQEPVIVTQLPPATATSRGLVKVGVAFTKHSTTWTLLKSPCDPPAYILSRLEQFACDLLAAKTEQAEKAAAEDTGP